MKKIFLLSFVSIFIIILLINKIQYMDSSTGEYKIYDVRIYKHTPAWELALAVKTQNTRKIKKIAEKNPNLLNYQDPKYGATLVLWSVGTEKYKSLKALLECGADPDIASKELGETPLFLAAGYSWVEYWANKDPKYVKLLLEFGADPNKNYVGNNIFIIETGNSPLMNSIRCGIEKTKALVEAGADINYKTKTGTTAAEQALLCENVPEYAYYLIVEKKAKVNEPSYRGEKFGDGNPYDKFYPIDLLMDWVFDLDSDEYKMKMEIVEEFASQGVNYWDTEIDKYTLEYIKKRYPDNWEEYIKKY